MSENNKEAVSSFSDRAETPGGSSLYDYAAAEEQDKKQPILRYVPSKKPSSSGSQLSESQSRSREQGKLSVFRQQAERVRMPHSTQEDRNEQAYYKTKLCPLYTKGNCKKGGMCNFAHGEKELRGLPNFKKTRLCIAYKNGDCPKASADCKYAHGEAELRKVTNTYRREESYYHKPRERQFRDDSRGNRERRDQSRRDQGRRDDNRREERVRDEGRRIENRREEYRREDARREDYRRDDIRRDDRRDNIRRDDIRRQESTHYESSRNNQSRHSDTRYTDRSKHSDRSKRHQERSGQRGHHDRKQERSHDQHRRSPERQNDKRYAEVPSIYSTAMDYLDTAYMIPHHSVANHTEIYQPHVPTLPFSSSAAYPPAAGSNYAPASGSVYPPRSTYPSFSAGTSGSYGLVCESGYPSYPSSYTGFSSNVFLA